MTKSPDAFRTISEVADALDVPAHVLRFWETRFAQVKPVKRGGGRRYYRPDDVRLLRGIRGLLYDDGLTIKGVQKILREQGVRHVIGLGLAAEAAPPPVAKRASAARPRPDSARPDSARPDAARPDPGARRVRATPTPRPAAPDGGAAPGPRPVPQGDLFAPAAEAAGAAEALSRARPLDRGALRALLAELEALRDRMVLRAGT